MTISRGKIFALCALALIVIVFAQRGCNKFAWGALDYDRVQTIVDEKTGLHVALGLGRSFSSEGYVLHVAEDDDPPWPAREGDVIFYTLHVKGDATLSYSGGCYIMDGPHETNHILRDKWKDPKTGQELCFELKGHIKQ